MSTVPGPPPSAEEVLVRLRVRLLGYAVRRVGRPEVAEDLVQDTFVLLTTKYHAVRAPEERVRLGIEILRKKMAMHWRKANRRGENDPIDPADRALRDSDPDPEEAAHRRLLAERLHAAVATLSGRCRELLRLKLEDRTFPEIAEILKAKLNTVYSWDLRCTKQLRVLLDQAGVRR